MLYAKSFGHAASEEMSFEIVDDGRTTDTYLSYKLTKGTSWGRAREGHSHSHKGGSGDLPQENFIFLDVRRDDFNAL